MLTRLKKWFTTSGKPQTSGYEHGASGLIYSNWHRRPPWSYWYADLMLLDPQVWFGLMIGNGPLMSAKVEVKCNSPEVKKFVEQQWDRLWFKSATQILRTKQYGFLAFEVICKEIDGRIEFDYLRDFHPVDVAQLKDRKTGARAGIRVRQIRVGSQGFVDLIGPKGLWLIYDQEFSRSWGRALLERCYRPWFDKNSDGGALDLRRLHGYKDAWFGDMIKYPDRVFNDPNHGRVHGRDLAREIGENRASGGVVYLPSTTTKDGKPEWEYQPPSTTGGDTAIPEWIHDLDWDILDGLLVPKEVVEAGGSGGGWSGRSVPWVGFLAVRDQEFAGYVRSITNQLLKPLALANFGADADDFDIEPVPLVETMGQQVGEMGKPELSKPEAAGTPARQPPAQEPKPGEAEQFSAQRGLFDEDEHPRGQPDNPGQFRAKGSAATFENSGGKQSKLFHGMDALPGQKDLFKGLNKKEGDEDQGDATKKPGDKKELWEMTADEAKVAGISWRDWHSAVAANKDAASEAVDPHANLAEGLWNALAEGKREAPARHHPDTIEEAVNLLHSARKYQPVDEADAVPFSVAHAPAGGITVAGQDFTGGEFIPGKVLAKATKEEKAEIAGKKSATTKSAKAPPPNESPARERSGSLSAAKREGKGKEARIILADGKSAPDWIKPSMVPPQWTDVHVATDKGADVLVRARDAKGRIKTVYSDNFTMRQAAAKFARVSELVAKRHAISEQNQANRHSDDAKTREAADCLWLIEEQGTRPGSDSDTKAKVKAYGATTLRAEHVEQDDDGSTWLRFVGKEGVFHNHRIRNPELAKMLLARKQSAEARGGKLFDTSDTALRDYTRSLDGGAFTPKDFRTAKATVLAVDEIKKLGGCCRDKKEYKAAVKQVATAVSSVLGNRPEQAITSYINPTVWTAWRCPDCA